MIELQSRDKLIDTITLKTTKDSSKLGEVNDRLSNVL